MYSLFVFDVRRRVSCRPHDSDATICLHYISGDFCLRLCIRRLAINAECSTFLVLSAHDLLTEKQNLVSAHILFPLDIDNDGVAA